MQDSLSGRAAELVHLTDLIRTSLSLADVAPGHAAGVYRQDVGRCQNQTAGTAGRVTTARIGRTSTITNRSPPRRSGFGGCWQI
jgi:hypothetical protein